MSHTGHSWMLDGFEQQFWGKQRTFRALDLHWYRRQQSDELAEIAPCKVIQDSIRFWIPRCGFRILPLQIPDFKTQKILDFSFWSAPNCSISFSGIDFNGGFRYRRIC